MLYEIQLQPEALYELKDAYEWYEEQKPGLGDEFIEEIEICYARLAKDPERFSYINNLYRRIKTDRFPYLLVYEIEDHYVIIYGVRHAKQKPL